MKKTKIKSTDRLCDAHSVTLRDILLLNLLEDNEIKTYYKSLDTDLIKNVFNVFLDKGESPSTVLFNLSINDKKALDTVDNFVMYVVSGKNNETGSDPLTLDGIVINTEHDDHTIVSFTLDTTDPDYFSYHAGGYSYANYVIYGRKDDIQPNDKSSKPNILLCKGKIYVTDVLYDFTESVLDGQ
ncbi:MAG: hypothetical protein KAH01_05925 [Caldisericia bacterium]|nr:hypothetical protein [Caldisericia bacterium]